MERPFGAQEYQVPADGKSVPSQLRTLAPELLLGGLKYLRLFQIGPTHPHVSAVTM